MNGTIARWTTPSIRYKPSQVEVDDIEEIYVVLSQNDKEKLRKSKADASISEDGFIWSFTQEDTGDLVANSTVKIQIDYVTNNGQRYTTKAVMTDLINSAVNEVIA